MGRRFSLLDPAGPVSNMVADFLRSNPDLRRRLPQNGRIRLFATDVTAELQKFTQAILGPTAHLQSIGDL